MRLAFVSPLFYLLAACAGSPTHADIQSSAQRISCASDGDCVARGGKCIANECRATNECAKDADCKGGEVCAPDTNFGGLCAAPQKPAQPQPAWSCAHGLDCPQGQGCGSDGKCHVDGECSAQTPCAMGICYNGGNDVSDGFCADARPSADPYCRSDGKGACRLLCRKDGTCDGGSCVNGFCHNKGECKLDGDCTPNHLCAPFADYESYGYSICVENPNPSCVPDGKGACRLACKSAADCLHGGDCGNDGLCRSSNECQKDADCPIGQACYPSAEFGGLCGATGR